MARHQYPESKACSDGFIEGKMGLLSPKGLVSPWFEKGKMEKKGFLSPWFEEGRLANWKMEMRCS